MCWYYVAMHGVINVAKSECDRKNAILAWQSLFYSAPFFRLEILIRQESHLLIKVFGAHCRYLLNKVVIRAVGHVLEDLVHLFVCKLVLLFQSLPSREIPIEIL